MAETEVSLLGPVVQDGPPAISRALVWTMAIASGLSVANLYYNQPLLGDIARGFGATVRQVGSIPLLTQVGYALGLLLFVPLGDMLERRRLIVAMLIAVSVSLAAAAVAPSVTWLAVASLAVGVTTIVPQLLIPLAAQLSRPEERGRVVGGVVSGLLIGILAARTLSGEVGSHLGWRAMYWFAAGLMVALAAACLALLPRSAPCNEMGFAETFLSMGQLIRTEPVLRRAAFIGAMLFGAFSAFWTTLVFHLAAPPYRYPNADEVTGLFGLVGVVGASSAPLFGRVADRRGAAWGVGIGTALVAATFVLFWAFGDALWALVLGVIVMDFAMQAAGVSNQTAIYSLRSDAHNRLNTVYMVTYFLGGSLGSFLGAWGWSRWHWNGVGATGLVLSLIALAGFWTGRERYG